MRSEAVPETFEAWKYCITRECGIPLTAGFIRARLAVLDNPANEETTRFRRLYGEAHWRRVVTWFQRAGKDAGA